jgi:ubiquitin carboxyl-terminal hydrolase 1
VAYSSLLFSYLNSKPSQALASLTYLQPQIDAIHAKAVSLDVPTPVIDALQELFSGMLYLSSTSLPIQSFHITDLNTPKLSYHSLRPHRIIAALSSPQSFSPSSDSSSNSNVSRHPSTSSTLFNSREHQDAQELFQLVSECIKNEMGAVEKEGLRDRGIAGVLDFGLRGSESNTEKSLFPNFTGLGSQTKSFVHNDNQQQVVDDARGWSLGSSNTLTSKSVFDGLTANRRSCVKCGYTEAVMHFGFDNWQLAVPRLAVSKRCSIPDPIHLS